MTNADKIRSMTNEQLIPVVMNWVCHSFFQCSAPCPSEHCDDCIRKWLKQEVDDAKAGDSPHPEMR